MIPEKEADPPDPVAYGRSIPQGLGINLLVRNVDRSARFQVAIFGAQVRYWEEHFAIMSAVGTTWLLHSDWTYRNHEMIASVTGLEARGGGIELRLYGLDPDEAEAAANRSGGRQAAWAARGVYRRRRRLRVGAVAADAVTPL